jgi:S1-C subfamily serine protease
MRDAEETTSDVAMIPAPDDPPAEESSLGPGTVLPDLTVARANPAIISRYGLPLSTEGVIVTDPGPLGGRVGVQVGDVVRAINGDVVSRSADVEAALTRPGRSVRMDLMRGGQRLSLRFRL